MSSALALTLRRSLFPALNESISEPTGRRHDRHSFHSHADPWLRPCRAFRRHLWRARRAVAHRRAGIAARRAAYHHDRRSEEHTSELQSLMRISYAVFCLKKKQNLTVKHNDRSH